MSGLYERDAVAWAEQQAALLGRLAAGERLNDLVDWANVIEEVRDVGLSELRACRSLLRQALIHLLRLHAWPDSPTAIHRRGELVGFLGDARDAFAPSMRQRVDLARLHAEALDRIRAGMEPDGEARSLPGTCPFTLDELLATQPNVVAMVSKIGGHP